MHIRVLLFPLLLAGAISAQSAGPAPDHRDASERINKIFAAYDHTDTPGCAAGVSVEGSEVLHAAYGMADLEHHVALAPDSVFEAGSVSKQFTAAAVLLLAEQGKLQLSDPVRKYFPELPDYGTPITVEQLMHHTSGLRDWGSVAGVAGWPRTTRMYSNQWVLDIAAHQKSLNYKPGDEWSYTNTGYNLLALLVERVSGKSLAQFTHDNVFLPLGMLTTSWRDDFQRIVPNRAIAYEHSGGSERQLMPFENAYGNGGLLTTVDDLLRWNDRFAGSKIGDATFLSSELEPGRLNNGHSLFYAAGLFIETRKGVKEISHSGATAGYRAWLGFYPDQKLSVAVLCNSAEANTTQLAHEVADVFLPAPAHSEAAAPAGVAPALVSGSEGLYESRRDHSTLTIERKDGKLVLFGDAPLTPVSGTSFRLSPEGDLFQLKTDQSGKVTGMSIVEMGYESNVFDKVERAHPSHDDMQVFVGDYVSDEAETTLTVALTSKGLELHQRPDAVHPLTPDYADAFDSELGIIRFLRDAKGRVTGLSVGESRVWDLRFRKVETK